MILRILFLFFAFSGAGAESDPATFAGRLEMNGISMQTYKGFEKSWHLVTSRYRKDSGEMRLTFANEAAWQALTRHETDFPDGAVFAKIGMATEEDPAFPSSSVPSGTRRYQFMVRQHSKFKETEGWGYALFGADGRTMPEEPHTAAMACAACHKIVADRGFVFSQVMDLTPFRDNVKVPQPIATGTYSFFDKAAESLPAPVRSEIPKGRARTRMLEGEIRKRVFQGTLDEVRLLLAREAMRSHLPALLLSENGRRFSLVYEMKGSACGSKQTQLKSVSNNYFNNGMRYEMAFCLDR